MSKQDMCAGNPPPGKVNPVDYLFDYAVKQTGFDYRTSASDAGSDHKPMIQHGLLESYTIPLDIYQKLQDLNEKTGALN
jgi:hypothetical protein